MKPVKDILDLQMKLKPLNPNMTIYVIENSDLSTQLRTLFPFRNIIMCSVMELSDIRALSKSAVIVHKNMNFEFTR